MGICPKCESPIEPTASVCMHCGELLSTQSKDSGTLNFDPGMQVQNGHESASTPISGGTLTPEDFYAGNPLTSQRQSDATVEGVEAQEVLQSKDGDVSDERKTIRMPEAEQVTGASVKPGGTWIYEGGNIPSGFGSKGKSGSEGQLKRVWEAAIGSSGKDSKQSLRHERAEASDSIFRRVATRQVADANLADSGSADYQIQDKVGEGGMGIVFSAIQTAVNRIVAIKSIRADKRGNNTARRQFFYEAEITAELDHPNIPPIYELGTSGDGLLFYSMKLIKGTEWQKLLTQKSRDENLDIFDKVADAVAFAHSKNVIHRDLKPDNVMLGTFGEVYLTDWGLGVHLKERQTIDFGGTPDFMSPEMAANQSEKIGKASDIYLLGGILFQIVTGMPPHAGRTPIDRLNAAKRNEIVDTKSDDPMLALAKTAMSFQPNERYASVGELQAAISQVRKHAESIALAERSEETAKLAASSKDYDRFTRAIFGFRDAIDMWGENKAAIIGLQDVRFAYGKCAFDKGDFDLAVQNLDQSIEEEAKLYEKAAKAKLAVEQREQRFKTLKIGFAAAIIFFLAISTALAGFASWKWRGESVQTLVAIGETEKAKTAEGLAKEEAKNARLAEERAKEAAIKATEAEKIAKSEEMKARAAEETAKIEEMKAKDAEMKAKEAEMLAKENQEKAESATIAKDKALLDEMAAKLVAEKRAAQIQIEEAQSKTALARLELDQFDIQGASKLLKEVKGVNLSVFGERPPKFDSWPLNRVSLLSNADLPKQELDGVVVAVEFAPGKNMGVAGTSDGKIHQITFDGSRLKIEQSLKVEGAKIDAIAISPIGDEAVVSLTRDGKSQLLAWPLADKQGLIPVALTENRAFQQVLYSPDGKQFIAGINGGVWIWKRESKWYSTAAEKQIEILDRVKGKLLRLEWMDLNTALATSTLNGKSHLHVLNIAARTSQSVEIPERLGSGLRVATFTGHTNRLLLGLDDGSILTGELQSTQGADQGLTIAGLRDLPRKHQTAITQIAFHPAGVLISVSDEPVAHVWQVKANGDVEYDTYLSGVPSESVSTVNLSRVAFLSKDRIAGVDSLGSAVVWSVERQKQRRQLTRSSESGAEEYTAPVIGVFNRSGSDQAIAVSSDGVIDRWNLQTGKTTKINGERFIYFGHTPGAEFVDSAVDMSAGVVVTSASLNNAQRKYLLDPTRMREYCVWDLASGNMLHRWLDPSDEKIAPRISLLGEGQMLLSSDSETRIVSLDGKLVYQNQDKGTYFAIPNPRDPSLVAMVKRSGLTWLWDRKGIWNAPSVYVSDQNDGDPIKAIWTEDGSRLYLAYDNGRLLVYDRVGRELKYVPPTNEVDRTWTAFFGNGYRVPHHYDLDFAVATLNSDVDQLYLNLRVPGREPKSRQTTVEASRRAAGFDAKNVSEHLGMFWLHESADSVPRFSDTIHDGFRLSSKSKDVAVARMNAGKHTLVSTRSAKVYDLSDKSTMVSLGRQPMLSVTSDRDGKSLWSLHRDGSIWNLEISSDGQAKWSRAGYSAEGFSELAVSPDGAQLAMHRESDKVLKIVDPTTGVPMHEFSDVAAMIWDPTPGTEATLAIAFSDGKIVLHNKAGSTELSTLSLKENGQIKSLNFFYENWSNDPKPISYVMVQSENESTGVIHFVPAIDNVGKFWEQSILRGAKLVSSPKDSIFVIGRDSGTVSVWFASPTWEKAGPLFDLPGHLGAGIACIAFSGDGNTLITSDKSNRLFGWLSKDSSEGD